MLATEQALSCGNATRMQLHREDSPKVSFMMREMKRDEFAVVDGCLGERAEVPGRSSVMAAQGLATIQPGQGSVQQRWPAYLAPCREGKGPERDTGR